MLAKHQRGATSIDDSRLTRTIHFSDGSISTTEVKWAEVRRVLAFKRDLLLIDLLCLGFETQEGLIEIDEEMDGWDSIIAALPKYLPGIRNIDDWWISVAKPAFATNMI